MNYDLYMPVKLISGKDCVKNFDFSFFGKRCFVMTGKTSAKKCGLLDDLDEVFKKYNIDYYVFDKVMENPTVEICYEAGLLADSFGADFIIGAGGGSAMDAAKAAAVFAKNTDIEPTDLFSLKFKYKPLPFILIGTTAGTGSEVTAVSVLTVNKDGRDFKKSVKSPLLYARVAFSDYKYTNSLSWDITVNTALDTLSHAVEALYSAKAGEMEMLYSIKAIEVCWKALVRAHWKHVFEKREIDSETREQLSFASILAGYAINAVGTCFPHALGYSLTTYKNVPHGKACAAFLGPFVHKMWGVCPERDEKLLKAVDESNIDNFLIAITRLLTDLPTLTKEEADAYTVYMYDYPSLKNSVVKLENDEILPLYKRFL